MAASFDKTCAIVDLNPTAKPLSYARGRQWLLWPVWAYRVVVPQPAPERFNLFQRAVLALCRAGIVHADEISDRLDLGSELTTYILNQLEGMGLLDRRRELTERAKKLLDEEPDDQVEAVAGYVFVDPFEGELWPRFYRGVLPYSEGEISGRSAKIEQGSVGNPRSINARVVWPDQNNPPKPLSRLDIVRACSRSTRAEAEYKRSIGEDDSELDGALLKRHLNQVVLLDDTPEPMFLTTFIFVPQDVSRASLWQVCDPFGLGTSSLLRKRIEKLTAESSQARDTLKNSIKGATREGFAVDSSDFLDLFREQNQKAAEVVDRKAGLDKTICPKSWELLVQMESEHIKVGGEDVSGQDWDREQEVLKAMVRRAYEAVEECLANVVRTFRRSYIWRWLGGAPEDNGVLLAKIACQLGFVDDQEDPCFERFLRIGSGPVKGVVLNENRELVALFAAALLSTQDHLEHPLRRCAAEFPELIVFFNELKRMRGQAAHHTMVDWEEKDREKALDFRKNTYHLARLLLPAAEGTTTDSRSSSAPTEWGAALVYRLRAQAAYNVEFEFGLHIREVPSLRDELVEVEFLSLELDKLRRAEATIEEVDGRTKDMRIACGNAAEAAVALLLTEADVSAFITDDRTANAERYSEAARTLGFQANKDGQYHEALLMVHPNRAREAAEKRRGALNALLVVTLLQAERDTDHPLREVAKADPRFLLDVGEVSQARGHGDGHENETIDPEVLKNYVVNVGKAVLDVLT